MRAPARSSLKVVCAIGVGQIFAWGTSFYLIAMLAAPVAQETGWPMTWIVAGQSLALLVAGLASPRVGRAIERVGGGRVLASASLLFAAGHVLLAVSHHLAVWYAGWTLLGLGMACGLYDAAFGALGQLYGAGARRAITNVTLFGGLASTICWPLGAVLMDAFGWRGACVVYAVLQGAVMFPMHVAAVPRPDARKGEGASAGAGGPDAPVSSLHLLLAAILTLAAATAAIVSVHLITLLQARGLALSVAVGMGAIFGPAQVLARIVELALGRHYHPVWTLFASVILVFLGVALFSLEGPVAMVAASLVLYGAGNGINSIARGAAPLALFGPAGYARLMGRLALPQLVAQAAAPPVAAVLIERHGAPVALAGLVLLAGVNVALAAVLLWATRRLRRG